MLCKLWFALFLVFFFGYFRKCVAGSEKLVYDYYGLWLGKPSPGQKQLRGTLKIEVKMLVISISSFSYNDLYPIIDKYQFEYHLNLTFCKCLKFGPEWFCRILKSCCFACVIKCNGSAISVTLNLVLPMVFHRKKMIYTSVLNQTPELTDPMSLYKTPHIEVLQKPARIAQWLENST